MSWRGNDAGLLELRAPRELSARRNAACRSPVSCRKRTCAIGCATSRPPASGWTCALHLSRDAARAIPGSSRRRRDSAASASHPSVARRVCAVLTARSPATRAAVRSPSRRKTAVFTWPGQFPQPIDLDPLKTTLYWKRTAEELLVATPDLALKTRDASVARTSRLAPAERRQLADPDAGEHGR